MAEVTSTALPISVHAPGMFNDLMLPNGSVIGQADDQTLRKQLALLGIKNAHTDPRNVIEARYAEMLMRVHDDAGSKAVNEWLQNHRT